MSAFRKWWQFVKKLYVIDAIVRCLSVFFYFLSLFYQDPVPISLLGWCQAGAASGPRENKALYTLWIDKPETTKYTFCDLRREERDGLWSPSASGSHSKCCEFCSSPAEPESSWGSSNADPVSDSTQSLIFNSGKNKARSYKLKIPTKVI